MYIYKYDRSMVQQWIMQGATVTPASRQDQNPWECRRRIDIDVLAVNKVAPPRYKFLHNWWLIYLPL